MQQYGIKLHPAKLFKQEMWYTGQNLSGEGIRMGTKDLEAVIVLIDKKPHIVGEVW